MSRMTDDDARRMAREHVEEYGPTRADWQRLALAMLERVIREELEAMAAAVVRFAAACLRGLARVIRR